MQSWALWSFGITNFNPTVILTQRSDYHACVQIEVTCALFTRTTELVLWFIYLYYDSAYEALVMARNHCLCPSFAPTQRQFILLTKGASSWYSYSHWGYLTPWVVPLKWNQWSGKILLNGRVAESGLFGCILHSPSGFCAIQMQFKAPPEMCFNLKRVIAKSSNPERRSSNWKMNLAPTPWANTVKAKPGSWQELH